MVRLDEFIFSLRGNMGRENFLLLAYFLAVLSVAVIAKIVLKKKYEMNLSIFAVVPFVFLSFGVGYILTVFMNAYVEASGMLRKTNLGPILFTSVAIQMFLMYLFVKDSEGKKPDVQYTVKSHLISFIPGIILGMLLSFAFLIVYAQFR